MDFRRKAYKIVAFDPNYAGASVPFREATTIAKQLDVFGEHLIKVRWKAVPGACGFAVISYHKDTAEKVIPYILQLVNRSDGHMILNDYTAVAEEFLNILSSPKRLKFIGLSVFKAKVKGILYI